MIRRFLKVQRRTRITCYPLYRVYQSLILCFDVVPVMRKTKRSPILNQFLSVILKMRKISPIRAPILFSICPRTREKPVKPSFPVRVENTPYNRPVCQNTTDLYLIQWPAMPFESSFILPHILPVQRPETLTEHQCEGRFL
jgi:hypothetical protein